MEQRTLTTYMNLRPLILAFSLLLAGCDNIAALMADPKVAQREADAKAVGGACRFGMRSIEDCYSLNAKASKSAVFTGWKDMDQYMRENKVEGIPSKMEKTGAPDEEVIEPAKAEKSSDAGLSEKPAPDAKTKPKAKPKEKDKPVEEKPPEKAS
ncbi:MAG: hypothetical protein RLZZ573_12 [Pseudomonadota bacterium]